MNLNRVRAVVSKDFYWAKNNSKLLGITLMPALMNVFFAKVAGSSIFAVGMSFSIAFLGVFLTSFLLIEEKRKGTLKALLTTPLTNAELLFGKFIFTFSLCLLIAFFSITINKRFDLLYNPLALLNIAIFSATTCFVGFVQGLFFKNEQEMSIAAPIVMLLFTVGASIEEATEADVAGFFPDYHFTHVLDSNELTYFDAAFHTSFNSLIAFTTFVFAVLFARFYFSNNEERRFSPQLGSVLVLFVGVFILSGLISPKLVGKKKLLSQENTAVLTFKSTSWSGALKYDSTNFQIAQIQNNKDLKKYKIKSDDLEIGVQIRSARVNEDSAQKRAQKIVSKKGITVLAREDLIYSSLRFTKWVSLQESNKLSVLVESMCEKQLFQVFFDLEKEHLEQTKKHLNTLDKTLQNLELECAAT